MPCLLPSSGCAGHVSYFSCHSDMFGGLGALLLGRVSGAGPPSPMLQAIGSACCLPPVSKHSLTDPRGLFRKVLPYSLFGRGC